MAIDINIMYTAGIIVEKPFYVHNGHAIDQNQRGGDMIVLILFGGDNQLLLALDGSSRDALHIFEQHLPDGEELTILVEIIGEIRLDA